MRLLRLRMVVLLAICMGIVIGMACAWLTPEYLNPFIGRNMTAGVFMFVTLIVITPLIGVAEMLWFWERSTYRDELRELRRSPQIGMGVLSPASIGLAIGLGIGWGLPTVL